MKKESIQLRRFAEGIDSYEFLNSLAGKNVKNKEGLKKTVNEFFQTSHIEVTDTTKESNNDGRLYYVKDMGKDIVFALICIGKKTEDKLVFYVMDIDKHIVSGQYLIKKGELVVLANSVEDWNNYDFDICDSLDYYSEKVNKATKLIGECVELNILPKLNDQHVAVPVETVKGIHWVEKNILEAAIEVARANEEHYLQEAIDERRKEISFQKRAYQKYQLQWMLVQGFTVDDICRLVDEWKTRYCDREEEEYQRYTFTDFLKEYGFDGTFWACFDEFLEAEYRDAFYMRSLLTKEEFVVWKNYNDFKATLPDVSVETKAGMIHAYVIPDSEYSGISVEYEHPDGGRPGAILEYDSYKKEVLLRVYGPEDPDGDPIALFQMKK